MADLIAGDVVVSASDDLEPALTRVVVNQHARSDITSPMVELVHSEGSLSLTPDHVLFLDGKFTPARLAKPGAALSPRATVLAAHGSTDSGIVNPITASSRILAAGAGGGQPVLASTHPEWIAEYLLTSSYPLPLSLCSLLSFLFPLSFQAFYDDALESLLVSNGASALKTLWAAIPASALPLGVGIIDAALSLSFVLFTAGHFLPVGVLGLGGAALTLRKA